MVQFYSDVIALFQDLIPAGYYLIDTGHIYNINSIWMPHMHTYLGYCFQTVTLCVYGQRKHCIYYLTVKSKVPGHNRQLEHSDMRLSIAYLTPKEYHTHIH